MEDTSVELKWTGKPEIFALLAFQQGVIDAAKLRKAIRFWLEQDQADLEVVLVEASFVSAAAHSKLARLMQDYARFDEVPPEPITSGLESPMIDESKTIEGDRRSSRNRRKEDGDSSQSRSKEKSRKRGKRSSEAGSYYDSFHEQFTREEKFLPGLARRFSGAKRKFQKNTQQLRQGSMALLDVTTDWLFASYQSLIAAAIGLSILAGIGYYASGWLRNQTTHVAARSSVVQRSNANNESGSTSSGETSLIFKPVPAGKSVPSSVGQPDSDEGRSADRASPTASVAPNPSRVIVTESETLAGETAVTGHSVDTLGKQLLPKVSQLVTNNDPELAVGLLESYIRNVAGSSSKEIQEALVAALLATKNFERVGQHLVDQAFLDVQAPTWDLMFTCWLFYASPTSRTAVAENLMLLAADAPGGETLQRVLARVDARDGQVEKALSAIQALESSESNSFSDALFLSVAYHTAGKKTQAVEQLDRAKELFEATWSQVDESDPNRMAARVGTKMARTAMSNYGNALDR